MLTLCLIKRANRCMSEIVYKGRTLKSGDELKVSFKEGKFLECIAEIDKNVLHLCSNSSSYSGGRPEKKHGKRYAYPIQINNGKSTNMNDSEMILLKKEEEFFDFKLSERMNRFFSSDFADYKFLFNVKNDVIANFDHINEPKKDDKELKDGYVVLHSKERSKMLKIRLGRLMRKLIINYNEKIGKEINNILPINDQLIERMHNQWVAYLTAVTHEFASGVDIYKGYTGANYHKKGSLGSCMTNAFDRLKFYTENPDKIRLLIVYYQGEVCGRSLVWNCDDGKTYHDRIYTGFDWVRSSMLEIFKKEGIKNAHGAGLNLKVSLKMNGNTTFPYLDTFGVKNIDKKYLSTC